MGAAGQGVLQPPGRVGCSAASCNPLDTVGAATRQLHHVLEAAAEELRSPPDVVAQGENMGQVPRDAPARKANQEDGEAGCQSVGHHCAQSGQSGGAVGQRLQGRHLLHLLTGHPLTGRLQGRHLLHLLTGLRGARPNTASGRTSYDASKAGK